MPALELYENAATLWRSSKMHMLVPGGFFDGVASAKGSLDKPYATCEFMAETPRAFTSGSDGRKTRVMRGQFQVRLFSALGKTASAKIAQAIEDLFDDADLGGGERDSHISCRFQSCVMTPDLNQFNVKTWTLTFTLQWAHRGLPKTTSGGM